MKKWILVIGCALLATSCVKSSKEYKTLLQEKDSLVAVNERTQSEFEEMLAILNEVEDGLDRIKKQENYLTVQSSATSEMNNSTRERIEADMALIASTLKNNREQLAKLEAQLKSGRIQSAELKKRVERLSQELEEKSALIESLQEELAKRNVRIQELDNTVTDLSNQVETLTQESDAQRSTLKQQEKELNAVWYVFGTRSELKEHDIISGGGLFSSTKVLEEEFDKDYFIQEDLRKLKKIPLYAKKVKVLSNQPSGSYRFEEDENENKVLVIDNPDQFWSLTRYLVVQVY